jgi:isopenicillin N synthase-like dioxygenase
MPHKAETREFTPDAYPDFPSGSSTVDLETISLAKLLLDKDEGERDRVFSICKGRGFFYLDLAGHPEGDVIAASADKIGAIAEDVFKLPLEEKMKYRLQSGAGSLDGYKVVGETVTDKSGTPDTAEFFNVGKNESKF